MPATTTRRPRGKGAKDPTVDLTAATRKTVDRALKTKATVGMTCPTCQGRGYEKHWAPTTAHWRERSYVRKGRGHCKGCQGRGHVPVPGPDVVLEVAMRCAFGDAGGRRGVVDVETGQLDGGCYQGNYTDHGLSVDWSARKVQLTATANRAHNFVDYGSRAETIVGWRRLLDQDFTWSQLVKIHRERDAMSAQLTLLAA